MHIENEYILNTRIQSARLERKQPKLTQRTVLSSIKGLNVARFIFTAHELLLFNKILKLLMDEI